MRSARQRVLVADDEASTIAIVAVAGADGLARVLESLGAHIVRPGHGTRPSVGEIAEGILAAGASSAIVLPNDRDAVLALLRDTELWRLQLVQQHVAERLMRRYAMAGTRRDLLTCAALFELAPTDQDGQLLLRGFETAFTGRTLTLRSSGSRRVTWYWRPWCR